MSDVDDTLYKKTSQPEIWRLVSYKYKKKYFLNFYSTKKFLFFYVEEKVYIESTYMLYSVNQTSKLFSLVSLWRWKSYF